MSSSAEAVVSERRFWLSVAMASFVQMIGVLALVGAAVTVADGRDRDAAIASAVGLALIPIAFGIVAVGTGKDDPGLSTFKAMAVFVLFTLSGGLVTPAFGIAAGVSAGAVFVVAQQVPHVTRARWIGVGVFVIYVFVLMLVAPEAGVFAVAVLPILSIALVDQIVGWWRSRRDA